MIVYQFRVDPLENLWRQVKPKRIVRITLSISQESFTKYIL